MPSSLIFKGSKGLNNKVDPERLIYDPDTGLTDIAACLNVFVDRTGRISRVMGYSATSITSDSHSLFPVRDEYCLYVTGTSLVKLSPDLTTTFVMATVSPIEMGYCLVGDDVYYANGVDKGIVRAGVRVDWTPGEYVGPETRKKLYGPPNGTMLEAYNGRMFVVDGAIVWFSEPFSYAHFRLGTGYLPFESKITFISSVRDGMVISDSNSIYTLVGGSPDDFRIVKVSDYPAIGKTAQKVSSLPVIEATDPCIVFTSSKGICAVTSECQFINLTENKLWYPHVTSGCAVILDDNYYFLGE